MSFAALLLSTVPFLFQGKTPRRRRRFVGIGPSTPRSPKPRRPTPGCWSPFRPTTRARGTARSREPSGTFAASAKPRRRGGRWSAPPTSTRSTKGRRPRWKHARQVLLALRAARLRSAPRDREAGGRALLRRARAPDAPRILGVARERRKVLARRLGDPTANELADLMRYVGSIIAAGDEPAVPSELLGKTSDADAEIRSRALRVLAAPRVPLGRRGAEEPPGECQG